MQLSHNGALLIEDEEGFREKAYKDSIGRWTLGFGTTFIDGKPVEEGMTCTRQQAELWMNADTASAQTAINQLVRIPLKQNQFDALVSFVYNIGIGAFRTSTMLKMINLRDDRASGEFDRWNKAGGNVLPGIVSRRHRERMLFEQ